MILTFAIIILAIICLSAAVFTANERDANYYVHKRQQQLLKDHSKAMQKMVGR